MHHGQNRGKQKRKLTLRLPCYSSHPPSSSHDHTTAINRSTLCPIKKHTKKLFKNLLLNYSNCNKSLYVVSQIILPQNGVIIYFNLFSDTSINFVLTTLWNMSHFSVFNIRSLICLK